MRYFWDDSKTVESIIKKSNLMSLFLDFDGTLSPLASTPDLAKLPKSTKLVLEELSGKRNVFVSIISGRNLNDIKRKVDLERITYSGNHGLEWELNGLYFCAPVPANVLDTLGAAKDEMINISRSYENSLVEDKGFSVAFHYRAVNQNNKQELERLLCKQLGKYSRGGHVSSIVDEETYDMRVNIGWTKGSIVNHLISKLPVVGHTSIYIGDGETDEDAFRVLDDSITIRVGSSDTSLARYFLKDVADVRCLLRWLLQLFGYIDCRP